MARSSYADTLSKRALSLYESYLEVKNWYDELSVLKTLRTAQGYTDSLAGFLNDVKKKPDELVKMNSDQAYDLMRNWAVQKRRNGSLTDGRISLIWFGVKNFFKFHKIRIEGDFPFSKMRVKYLDKIPTKQELKRIIQTAPSISTRIAIQLMAYSGLRPEDICDLTYASIKHDFEKDVTPCVAYIPQSKSDEVYVTFIPEPTITHLKQYFRLRMKKGEEINDSSPIYRSQQSIEPGGIRRKTLTQNIENTMKKSGIELSSNFGPKIQRMRPYSLRKYFRSNLAGHVPTEFAEAWTGHTSGLAQIYNGARDLDPATIERMRRAYRDVERYLVVEAVDEEQIINKVFQDKEMKKRDERIRQLEAELSEATRRLSNYEEEIGKIAKLSNEEIKAVRHLIRHKSKSRYSS